MALKQLLDLTGRTALITGGSRGLGLQIATGYGEMGARVRPFRPQGRRTRRSLLAAASAGHRCELDRRRCRA